MREDVYKVVKHVYDSTDRSKLHPEDARFLEKVELQYRRDGLALSESDRNTLKALKKRLSELKIDFQKNINEDKTSLQFSNEQLEGMPGDYLQSLKKENDLFVVTMKYPDLFPILNRATNEQVRQSMDVANSTRCKENVAILEEAIQIREKMSKLLGYADHAAFTLEVRMAKQTDRVRTFLEDLKVRLRPLAQKELDVLLALKKKEKEQLKADFDGKLNSWDFRYYHRLLLEQEYQVNEEEIKEYFSLTTVTKGMLDLYQQVLGLKFTEVTQPPVWHTDVSMYKVEDSESSEMVGYFYLDLFPRDGKYTHAGIYATVISSLTFVAD
jgi:Zn-dependent oligopeptidase